VLTDSCHERGDEIIALHSAVAVFIRGHSGEPRGDDERRIGDDAVELLALDRFEQRPSPGADAAHSVEQGVEPREPQRALRHVGRDDVGYIAARAQRLDAAPRADVESVGDGSRQLQAGQGERGAADTEDVILGQRSTQRGLVQVAGDPPLPRTAVVGERLRADDRSRRHHRTLGGRQPEPHQPVGTRARQCRHDHGLRLRHPEHEKPAQHGERVSALAECPDRG